MISEDCAAFWGFQQLYGLSEASDVSAAAAYAVSAGLGGALGRLAWAEGLRGRCLEALEVALAVAGEAVQGAPSAVPQPMDLDHLRRLRREERESYALAAQLASDGHAEGLAAKAEMPRSQRSLLSERQRFLLREDLEAVLWQERGGACGE